MAANWRIEGQKIQECLSGHSRGSTLALTIVYLDGAGQPRELDMGTGFDLFDPRSWPNDASITARQQAHRMLLQVVMERHGFAPYPQEWWHFTLKNEPYPDTYRANSQV